MTSLKIIPVIDILNGKVVHAVRGQRSQYQPLQSSLTPSTEPAQVTATFKALGFSEVYVADLDAIIDCANDFSDLKPLLTSGVSLMVDAGITSLDRAQKLLKTGIDKLVIGTETLQNKRFVAEAVAEFGSSHVVVSLDLKGETVLTKASFDGSHDALTLLGEFKAMGVRQVIVLDLLRVGSGEGVNKELLKRVTALGGLDVYAGGGVRNIEDLIELQKIGLKGALIATALHTGKITVADLKQNGFL
ncbi:MAG: HisA/HisF-related TIM barrel protein [Candidatus Bathyarchaeota archaeon]|nr:HisA/HisF-related TIM barrel protein [Candidatus Bathyarchaeota archaeon]